MAHTSIKKVPAPHNSFGFILPVHLAAPASFLMHVIVPISLTSRFSPHPRLNHKDFSGKLLHHFLVSCRGSYPGRRCCLPAQPGFWSCPLPLMNLCPTLMNLSPSQGPAHQHGGSLTAAGLEAMAVWKKPRPQQERCFRVSRGEWWHSQEMAASAQHCRVPPVCRAISAGEEQLDLTGQARRVSTKACRPFKKS